MKLKLLLSSLLIALSFLSINAREIDEEDKVEKCIEIAIDAHYNKGDIKLIKKYYHTNYILMITEQDYLYSLSYQDIIDIVKHGKLNNEYPPKEKVSIKIKSTEIAGNAATVYFDFFRGTRRTCADFVSLYKISGQWKIVSQTTYHYQD